MDICSICLSDPKDAQSLSCSHVFCSMCINKWTSFSPSCPICRKSLHSMAVQGPNRAPQAHEGFTTLVIDNCTIHEMVIGYPRGYVKHIIYISDLGDKWSAEVLANNLVDYYDMECVKIRWIHPDLIPLPSATLTTTPCTYI